MHTYITQFQKFTKRCESKIIMIGYNFLILIEELCVCSPVFILAKKELDILSS